MKASSLPRVSGDRKSEGTWHPRLQYNPGFRNVKGTGICQVGCRFGYYDESCCHCWQYAD